MTFRGFAEGAALVFGCAFVYLGLGGLSLGLHLWFWGAVAIGGLLIVKRLEGPNFALWLVIGALAIRMVVGEP